MKLQAVGKSHSLDAMSLFSSALEGIKEETGKNQSEIGDLAGITSSSISRYFSGGPVSDDALLKLCKAFPVYAGRLAEAWIRDHTPDDVLSFVQIIPEKGGIPHAVSGPPPWESLPARVRQLLEAAAKAARDRPRFAKKLEAILEP